MDLIVSIKDTILLEEKGMEKEWDFHSACLCAVCCVLRVHK